MTHKMNIKTRSKRTKRQNVRRAGDIIPQHACLSHAFVLLYEYLKHTKVKVINRQTDIIPQLACLSHAFVLLYEYLKHTKVKVINRQKLVRAFFCIHKKQVITFTGNYTNILTFMTNLTLKVKVKVTSFQTCLRYLDDQ